MSIDFLNNQFQLDDEFNSEDYFNALISPVPENKKAENPTNDNQDNTQEEMKYNPQASYVENTIHPNMNNLFQTIGVSNNNNNTMLKHRQPSPNIIQQNYLQIMQTTANPNNLPIAMVNSVPTKIKIVQGKRKIAETTNNLQVPNNNDYLLDEEEDLEVYSPAKKTKKGAKGTKKTTKKENPKRKRVNYCFEIHRSGCALNKNAKLYCKVFLKGKLQSEVDLIKGARGKWAYTFYDQRKKKKERRYWPSQSSGPIIEDPCSCDKCIPGNSLSNDEEVDFSSPSTEDATLIDYDQSYSGSLHIKSEYQQQPKQILIMPQGYENQIVYYPNNFQNIQVLNYLPNEIIQEQYLQFLQANFNSEFHKNLVLKSSNDFQDNRNSLYLKSSNDFMNHQKPWENFHLPTNNNSEYGNDGFFVHENSDF